MHYDSLTFPETRDASEGLKELLRSMLVKDLEKRPKVEEICQNEWLNKGRKNLKEEM